jgi:hypothetical protein
LEVRGKRKKGKGERMKQQKAGDRSQEAEQWKNMMYNYMYLYIAF